MTTVSKQLPQFIEDKNRRLNIKSKRRRNLIKKVIELKRMCGQEILLFINDKEFDKMYIYNSSPETFNAMRVNQILNSSDSKPNNKTHSKFQTYIDENYTQLKNCESEGRNTSQGGEDGERTENLELAKPNEEINQNDNKERNMSYQVSKIKK